MQILPTAKPTARAQMDGVRAGFVFFVLVIHALPGQVLFEQEFGRFIRFFFVLSSFIITTILLRFRDMEVLETYGFWQTTLFFWRSRALRIFPPYFVLLAFLLAMGNEGVRETIWWHLTFTSNFLFAARESWAPYVTAHYWTLAIEEQFYLIWPFAAFLLPPRRVIQLGIGMILLCILYKAFAILTGAGIVERFTHTLASLDGFAIGGILALLLHDPKADKILIERRLFWASVATVMLHLVVFLLEGQIRALVKDGLLDTAMLIPLAWLMIRFHENRAGLLGLAAGSRPVAYLGRISYGIYIYHNFVWLIVVQQWIPEAYPEFAVHSFGGVLAFASLTIALASLSWHFLELPLMRLSPRKEIQPAASRPPAAPAISKPHATSSFFTPSHALRGNE